MPDPSREDLAAIQAERAAMFRPAWFRALVRAELGLGETFWAGHLGIQLVLLPLWLLMIVVLPPLLPDAGGATIAAFYIAQAVWSVLVTSALIRIVPRAAQAGVWRWVAVLVSLLITVATVVMLRMWFAGAL